MDSVTPLAIGGRESALLLGDYSSYRKHLSQKLRATRRRLGRATKKNAKYTKESPVTSENIKSDAQYVHLLLLSAERSWAHAMAIKSAKSEDTTGKPLTGLSRDHIISRLTKAAKYAGNLLTLLRDREASGSSTEDLLAARAYLGTMAGALQFEKQAEGTKTAEATAVKERWHACLKEYSVARIIYAAINTKANKDLYKDLIANTIDPTIRYASYQAKLPRTLSVPLASLRFFPKEEQDIAGLVKETDPQAFVEHQPVKDHEAAVATGEAPSSIKWRGRTAAIADASIGQALAQASVAERKLEEFLQANSSAPARKKGNAYDDILIAYQDACDANRRAIEELEKEGVDEGDSRMQDLRVSSLSINYDTVSWRVGRNRVLTGDDDGRSFTEPARRPSKRSRNNDKPVPEHIESRSRKLARLKERAVLYDLTLQSIDSIKSLRGAMRDTSFVAELDGRRAYFQSLKCLSIAVSHALLGNHLNALALSQRAADLAASAAAAIPPSARPAAAAPTLDVHASHVAALQAQLDAQVRRHRALAGMHALEADAARTAARNRGPAPLVERLGDFPPPGVRVDLANLVAYPPRLQSVAVKPLFFDVAYNYLQYPGQAKRAVERKAATTAPDEDAEQSPRAEAKKSKGWFGFGR